MAYKKFFGLKDSPFRITPDIEYYFPTGVHSVVLENLMYSIKSEDGLIQLTGAPGTGKTLTIRALLYQLKDDIRPVIIYDPSISAHELLTTILKDLGIQTIQKESREELIRLLKSYLVKNNNYIVIVIDEAQSMEQETLEQLGLLTNIESGNKKWIKVILAGQALLEHKLSSPEFDNFHQLITTRYKLDPISKQDMFEYVKHRLRVAGYQEDGELFDEKTLRKIYKISNGIPRIINIICERSLMTAFIERKTHIETGHIKKAFNSISGEAGHSDKRKNRFILLSLIILFIALLSGFGKVYNNYKKTGDPMMALQGITDEDLLKFSDEGFIYDKSESLNQKKNFNHKEPQKTKKNKNLSQDKKGSLSALDTKLAFDTKNKTLAVVNTKTEPVTSPPKEIKIPPEFIVIPTGGNVISIDSQANELYQWKKESNGAKLLKSMAFNWTLSEGLFLLGAENGLEFIFQPQLFNFKAYKNIAGNIFNELEKYSWHRVFPLLISNPKKLSDKDSLNKAREIPEFVNKWSQAWQDKDLETYMNFYSRNQIMFYQTENKTIVYSWENLYDKKNRIFSMNSFIEVKISNLTCVLNPVHNNTAIVLFHQEYNSDTYSDKGIKVLYLNLEPRITNSGFANNWRIVVRFWIEIND